MRLNIKSRKFIGAIAAAILIGLGVNVPGSAELVTEVYCGIAKCD